MLHKQKTGLTFEQYDYHYFVCKIRKFEKFKLVKLNSKDIIC